MQDASEMYICLKYPSFSKVGGNYPLDLKIIWSSAFNEIHTKIPLRKMQRIFFFKFIV
jgi:hypothetical protein